MPIKEYKYETIDLVNLLLDVNNPRFETQLSQQGAIRTLVLEQGPKLVKLAEHIARFGPNPSEMPIVIKSRGDGHYTVLEGNRRIAAIKLCAETELVDSLNLPPSTAKKLKSLNAKYGSSLPLSLKCTVAHSRKQAKMWIELRHTGERGGVGIIRWSGVAASRFRGESPELQLLEQVKDSVFLDEETREELAKMPITNLQRILGTPEARRTLGVDISNKQLIVIDRDEALGRMAIVVSDLANKHITVRQLHSKDQRVEYADAVAARALPTPGERISATKLTTTPASKEKSKKKKPGSGARSRISLIPKSLRLEIAPVRIAKIYDELQRLRLDNFENSGAVLLRVFLEMSLNEFAERNQISLRMTPKRSDTSTTREMSLKKKVSCVVDYLVENDSSCKKVLHGIRMSASSPDTIFGIGNWQQYVHNQHYNPVAKDLRTIWDNIQPLFEKVWA